MEVRRRTPCWSSSASLPTDDCRAGTLDPSALPGVARRARTAAPEPAGAERQRTIALLLDIAHDPRFSLRGAELADLASAVRGGVSHEAPWRGVNLQWMFPAESTVRLRPRRRRGVARILGLLALVLSVVHRGC